MTGLFRDIVTEQTVFRGKPPDVPLAGHINADELTSGDNDPFFVTLKIGKVDSMSGNGNYYDESNIREIARQVVGLDSNMGHVSASEVDSAYPMPAGHWVGASLVDGVLWAKLYVPKTRPEIREFFRVKKAQNGQVSTSIYSFAKREYDAKLSGYRLKDINLETIDLAPVLRSGVKDLASVPYLTREMSDDKEASTPMTDKIVDKYSIIAEMTVKDAPYVPEAVQEQIIGLSSDHRLVVEMSKALDVDSDGVLARVTELLSIERKHAELVTEQINRSIVDEVTAQVMPDVVQVTDGVKAVREMVVTTVKANKPADSDAVKLAVAEAVKQPMVQEMAKLALSAMGKHERGGSRNGGGSGESATDKYMTPKPASGGEA